MKLNWGWRIAILYVGFMGLIICLVVASTRQHFDLVSKDYYGEEIAYQKVLDASKNQASLSSPILVRSDNSSVTIEFPSELKDKGLSGDIRFYSPVDATWDRDFKIDAHENRVSIQRSALKNTRYTIKISCTADGKSYYQESEIQLHS